MCLSVHAFPGFATPAVLVLCFPVSRFPLLQFRDAFFSLVFSVATPACDTCVVARSNSHRRVALRGCGKLRGQQIVTCYFFASHSLIKTCVRVCACVCVLVFLKCRLCGTLHVSVLICLVIMRTFIVSWWTQCVTMDVCYHMLLCRSPTSLRDQQLSLYTGLRYILFIILDPHHITYITSTSMIIGKLCIVSV